MSRSLPDKTAWRKLLRSALRVIDSLRTAGYGDLDFRLGGGTVLMFAFDHRISNNIDIFFDDAQALSFLSPRLNELSATLATDYHEQANSIKLVLPDGDIDFIVAGSVTRAQPDRHLAFDGRAISLDPVAEILAKKLLYRAASFKARDLYDLAVVLEADRATALEALAATVSLHDALLRRLERLASAGGDERLADIHATGRPLPPIGQMVAAVRSAIGDIARRTEQTGQ